MAEAIAPLPGPKGPTLGTLAPKADNSVHAMKATGSGAHSNGGATKDKRQGSGENDSDEPEQQPGDSAMLRGGYSAQSERLTIHAAISHFQGSSEATTLSAAQLSEFKSLLNKHRPPVQRDLQPASNAYVVGGLGESTWFSVNSDRSDDEEKLLREFRQNPAVKPLTPAKPRPFVNLPPELAPQSAAEEELLFLLTTDPRAGFAPEGVAAYIAWCKHGLELERPHNATSDFRDSKSKQSWNVAPIRETAPRPISEIQAAVSIADANSAFLLADAAHLEQLEGTLGKAVRELAATESDTRILVVLGPTDHVLTAS
jgi:hypothetical protein